MGEGMKRTGKKGGSGGLGVGVGVETGGGGGGGAEVSGGEDEESR